MQSLRKFFKLLPDNAPESASYPFFEEMKILDNIDDAYNKLEEIQKWLISNIGPYPNWTVSKIKIEDNFLIFHFLFKHPEDVVAFKLRWL